MFFSSSKSHTDQSGIFMPPPGQTGRRTAHKLSARSSVCPSFCTFVRSSVPNMWTLELVESWLVSGVVQVNGFGFVSFLVYIWFRGSSRGRNKLYRILWQSAQGLRFCNGSKFAVCHCAVNCCTLSVGSCSVPVTCNYIVDVSVMSNKTQCKI